MKVFICLRSPHLVVTVHVRNILLLLPALGAVPALDTLAALLYSSAAVVCLEEQSCLHSFTDIALVYGPL